MNQEKEKEYMKMMHLMVIRRNMMEHNIEPTREYTMEDSCETLYNVREEIENQVKKKKNRELFEVCVRNYLAETGEEGKQEIQTLLQNLHKMVEEEGARQEP